MKVRYLIGLTLAVAVAALQGLALADEPQPAGTETEYFAVFMEGKKVGHAIQSRVVADGKVTTSEELSITISRADTPVTVDMEETSIETTDGKPLGFEAVQELGGLPMKVAGTLDPNGVVNLTLSSMGVEQKNTIEWPSGAVMAEGLRLLTLENFPKKGMGYPAYLVLFVLILGFFIASFITIRRWTRIDVRAKALLISCMVVLSFGFVTFLVFASPKEDTQYSAKVFSPGILQALDTQIRIGPRRNVDLLGRVVPLTEVTSTYVMPGTGQVVSTSYVDDELLTRKSIMPIAGMQVEMVACTRAFALSDNDVFEIIDKVFVASPVPLTDVHTAKSISYLLSPTSPADSLEIPVNDNQRVRKLEDGKILVVVEPVAAPPRTPFPYKGKDETILEAMKPNRFLQSDHKEVIDLASRAVGQTKDAAEAARRIESFVAKYIKKANLSVGYASAVEVAAGRQGDCSEFSVLTAAMCRAVGIPAQVAVGVAYVEQWEHLSNCFGPHAWVQAYVGGKWVGLDAAFKSAGLQGYGPGHIALAVGNGNPEDFFNLVTTLGQFKIDKVTVNRE